MVEGRHDPTHRTRLPSGEGVRPQRIESEAVSDRALEKVRRALGKLGPWVEPSEVRCRLLRLGEPGGHVQRLAVLGLEIAEVPALALPASVEPEPYPHPLATMRAQLASGETMNP